MSFPRWMSVMRCVSFAGSAALLTAAFASAQSGASQSQPNAPGFSSSSESSSLQLAEASAPASPSALPSAPSAAAAGGGQQYNGGWGHKLAKSYALEFGGGFNAPESTAITYGGNFTVGAGAYFNKRLAMLAEYQFMDDKLPGYLIAETGANGGYAHIWSFTLDPYFDLFPKAANDLYVTGGGGFYRKVTSFTDPGVDCSYFYGCYGTNQVVGHFSSNQGGWNIGAGYQHRLGGMYGDGKMKLFAEVRYLDVLTPAVTTEPNGLGTTTVAADTKMIPVTLGVRW